MNSIFLSILIGSFTFAISPLYASQAPTDLLDHGVERIDSSIPSALDRVADGKDAQCDSLADVGYPAYRLAFKNVRILNDTTVAEMRVTTLVCQQVANGFMLVESSPVVNWPNQYLAIDYSLIVFSERYQVLQEIPLQFGSSKTDFTLRIPSTAPVKLEAFVRSLLEYNNERVYKPFGSYYISLNSPQ